MSLHVFQRWLFTLIVKFDSSTSYLCSKLHINSINFIYTTYAVRAYTIVELFTAGDVLVIKLLAM